LPYVSLSAPSTPRPPCSTLFPYTTLFRSHNLRISFLQRLLDFTDALANVLAALDHARFGEISAGFEAGCVADLAFWHQSPANQQDRKSTRLNSSHVKISYAVFCLKKKRDS